MGQNRRCTLSAPIKKDVYSRIAELAEEEQQYCDKGNFKHMAQILTSIALYETLKNHGKSEEEVYRIVSEEMWKFLDPSGMQKLAKKSFFLPLMKRIVPLGFKKVRARVGVTLGTKTIQRMSFILSATSVFTRRSSAGEI